MLREIEGGGGAQFLAIFPHQPFYDILEAKRFTFAKLYLSFIVIFKLERRGNILKPQKCGPHLNQLF